jgi:outer membrane receptor protein involved in Fe transport
VAINTDRASTTITNNQFDVPATGWGSNAALRGTWDWLSWEAGVDARFAEGESRELYGAGLTSTRTSGGRSMVAGVYVESASRFDGWLLTLGLRADQWETANGHLIQTGSQPLNVRYPSRSGTLPTVRAGVRRELGDGLYLRAAAYEGFRAPSLNELYRPFRVGQITTLANPALSPEELYGAEIGIGGGGEAFSWDVTAFWNQLHDPIANVTTGTNLQMRENSFNINAPGVEAEAKYALNEMVTLTAAFDAIAAHTKTISVVTGLPIETHPAQAPRWTATGGVEVKPLDRLTLFADFRYESGRFADDQNTIPLSAATTVDARASWAFTPSISGFVFCDNLFNAHVASTAAFQPVKGDPAPELVTNYSAPRIVGAGISFTQ